MASDSGDSGACGDDLCESLSYDAIYRFVETGTAIELDEHRCRNSNRSIADMSAAHGGANLVVAVAVSFWPCQRGDSFGVEN